MKAYIVNKNSWHYKLASFYENGNPSPDFCNYFWEVVFGLVKVGLVSSGIALALLVFGVGTVAWVWEGVAPWSVVPAGAKIHVIAVFYLIELFCVAAILVLWAWHEYREWRDEKERAKRKKWWDNEENVAFLRKHGYWPWEESKPKEPGFVSLAYRKLKDKTCVRLTFE